MIHNTKKPTMKLIPILPSTMAPAVSSGATTTTTSSSSTVVPTPLDVIFGRGKRVNSWPGNVLFRHIVWSHRATYEAASRRARGEITKAVVDQVLAGGGRFIQADAANGGYVVASLDRAMEKAAQALREADVIMPKGFENCLVAVTEMAKTANTKKPAAKERKNKKLPKKNVTPSAYPTLELAPMGKTESVTTATVDANTNSKLDPANLLLVARPLVHPTLELAMGKTESATTSIIDATTNSKLDPANLLLVARPLISPSLSTQSVEDPPRQKEPTMALYEESKQASVATRPQDRQEQCDIFNVIPKFVSPLPPGGTSSPSALFGFATDASYRATWPAHLRVLYHAVYPHARHEEDTSTVMDSAHDEFMPNRVALNPANVWCCGANQLDNREQLWSPSSAGPIQGDDAFYGVPPKHARTLSDLWDEEYAVEDDDLLDFEPLDEWFAFSP